MLRRLALPAKLFLLGFFDSSLKEKVSKWTLSAAITSRSYYLSEELVQALSGPSTLRQNRAWGWRNWHSEGYYNPSKKQMVCTGNLPYKTAILMLTHIFELSYSICLAWLLISFFLVLPISLWCVCCAEKPQLPFHESSPFASSHLIDHTNIQVTLVTKKDEWKGFKTRKRVSVIKHIALLFKN